MPISTDHQNKSNLPSPQEDGNFKAMHPVVLKAFNEMDNYLIEYNGQCTSKWCCIYFSGNSIYYPSRADVFEQVIIRKNRFEFYGTRLRQCSKHIFIRDIHKQWYLKGINVRYDSIEKVAEFLRKETEGYQVITLGSSAGGYAAALFATLIKACYAICIDAQFTLHDEAIMGEPEKNPIVCAMESGPAGKYFDLNNVLGEVPVYYFYSAQSVFEQRSLQSVQGNRRTAESVCRIPGNVSSHRRYGNALAVAPS